MTKQRKKTSREHKAAVELARNRRALSKALKKEGFDGVPLDKKPKTEAAVTTEVKKVVELKEESKEERATVRKEKLQERKKRSQMLLTKTKKGQPIMKNLVNDLLAKLSRS
jgi:hypothetical protein